VGGRDRVCPGQANFLFDPASEPYMTADQLSEAFGVVKSTMGSKARQVRDLLRISPFSPEFQRADVAEQSPLAWIIAVWRCHGRPACSDGHPGRGVPARAHL